VACEGFGEGGRLRGCRRMGNARVKKRGLL